MKLAFSSFLFNSFLISIVLSLLTPFFGYYESLAMDSFNSWLCFSAVFPSFYMIAL
jgi:hypothetical protein